MREYRKHRGETIAARNAAKTHCPKGHAYTPMPRKLQGGLVQVPTKRRAAETERQGYRSIPTDRCLNTTYCWEMCNGACMEPKRYRTIVADPPWPYERARYRFAWRQGAPSGGDLEFIRYPVMRLPEIAALPVATLAEDDAHLYIWTTQRFLQDAYAVAEVWGFSVSKALVWCKPPTGFALGGTYGSAVEFCLFARRGSLAAKTKVPRDWFDWPRAGGHSAKPEAFQDMVETVSPGPYLELFARRQRLGWDTWGNQALNHVALTARHINLSSQERA